MSRLLHFASAFTLAAASLTAAETSTPTRAIDPVNMDTSVKACEDFYHYANGGWIKTNPIPPDKARWGGFEELADRNRAVLHTIVDEAAAKSDWPKGSLRQKVGDFYAAGMDEKALEAAGAKPLKPWLAKIDGLKSAAELPSLLADLHRHGLSAAFRMGVAQDQKESTRYLLQLNQGGLGLPERDYYFKDDDKSKEIRDKYVAHVERMLALAGDDAATAKQRAAVVLALETRLAKASKTRVELRDPQKNYNKRTVAELVTWAPGFDWKVYLTGAGALATKTTDQDVNLRQPEFLKAFAAEVSSTPIEEWKTYLRWHAVRSAAPYLSKAFDEESFAFGGKVLNGVPQQEERWKRVLAATDGGVGEALGQLYVEKTFSPAAKARMKELIENLRSALRERIEALPWMGPDTKKQALKKLAAFGVKIGYPDKWKDYTALEVSRASYFDNVVRANAFEQARNLKKLGGPIDRTEWGMTPPTVNAYYSPTMNEIVFPAGILQPPFFYAEGDDAVNYGGIGGVIGHEMTHGFDDSGSQYDADGNLKNWWTDEDKKAYESRTDLVVKQFGGYKALPDQTVNGKLTLGENIADLGGLKIAYAALQKALQKDPSKAKPIDGLTPGQRFFFAWAAVWRNNIRDEALRVRLNTDTHSPGQYRVLGPLSNLPEFHEAFACGEGTPMRRVEAERPTIW